MLNMAHIQSRIHKGKKCYRNTFRVIVRPKGCKAFTITFSSIKKAKDWLEEHEDSYRMNSESYKAWHKANVQSMRKNGIFHNHIPLDQFLPKT